MSLIWIEGQSKMVEMADTEGNEVEYQGMNADAAQKMKESFESTLMQAARMWWSDQGNQLYDTLFEFQTYEHEGDNDLQDLLNGAIEEIDSELARPWAIETSQPDVENSK